MAPRRNPWWGWLRAFGVLLAFGLAQGAAMAPVIAWRRSRDLGDLPLEWGVVITTIPSAAVLILWWLFVTRQPLRALGLVVAPRGVKRYLAGLAIGIGLISIIAGAGVLAGAWTIHRGGDIGALGLLAWTPLLAGAAFNEELLCRGHLLQETGRRWPMLGVVFSSCIFATLHLLNPNSGEPIVRILVMANIIAAGLLLAAAFLHSQDLWLPAGLHLGWNWAESILFGLPVSGFDTPSILRGEMNPDAPVVLSSSFGPESSVLTAGIVGVIALAWLGVLAYRGLSIPAEPRPQSRRS